MSTYIGIRCVPCGERTNCGIKAYATRKLQQLVSVAPQAQDCLLGVEDLDIDIMGWQDEGNDPTLTDFLREHGRHELIVFDEYGLDYPAGGHDGTREA